MGKLSAAISCWLLTVGTVMAQTGPAQTSQRMLPQWLTGIIAVVAFLFLAFVAVLVKKAWCAESSRAMTSLDRVRENEFVMANEHEYATSLDMVRSKEDENAYDNPVIDNTDNKVTAM